MSNFDILLVIRTVIMYSNQGQFEFVQIKRSGYRDHFKVG